MADCCDANRLPTIGQLVENSICTHPQRVKAAELSPQGMARKWIPLE